MPSIRIREEDLTGSSVTNVTTNAVYIPGYAIMGPINTPTLCESLDEFQSIFGAVPYVFNGDQELEEGFDDSIQFYQAGDYEKSYIIAEQLLTQGLPVYYERVFTGSISDWSAQQSNGGIGAGSQVDANCLILTASTPGAITEKIYYTLERDLIDNKACYTLTVGREADTTTGAPAVSGTSTRFTFDSDLASQYSSIKYYQDLNGQLDNSGLVTLEFSAGVQTLYETDSERSLVLPASSFRSKDEFTVKGMYTYLSTNGVNSTTGEMQGFTRLEDKGEYVLKYITSGAYPTFGYNDNSVAVTMIETAADRGDAIALLDPTWEEVSLSVNDANSIYGQVKAFVSTNRVNTNGDMYSYAGMYIPYGIYSFSQYDATVKLPGSFAYLLSLAVSVQANPNWYAVAGVVRGLVPNIQSLAQNITNAVADSYTPTDDVAINPITNIRPYGLSIWGNRTLKNNALQGELTATSFMNIRNLVCDVKRVVYVAAKRLTFEQNNDVLWINFKSMITPTLEQMLQGNGITGYRMTRLTTTERATLKARIELECVEAVENFDITISLTDSTTLVSEE